MKEFSKRQRELLQLLACKEVINSEVLGKQLHVSSRTIRNEIKEINQMFSEPCILSSKGSGFYLNDQINVNEYLSVNEDAVELHRNFEILKELLSVSEINFYELADALYISESTLQKGIMELNDIIAKRNINIQIKRHNNNIYLDGNEEARRQASTYFLMHEINEYDFDLNNYLHFFRAFDLDELKQYILAFNEEKNIRMRDIEVLSFVIHVAIMLERVLQGNEILTVNEVLPNKKYDLLAQDFFEGLTSVVDVTLSKNELHYLACLFAGKLPILESDELKEMQLFMNDILAQVQLQFELDLNQDKDFRDRFLIHLLGLKNRIDNQTFINNPLMEDIKKHFPIVYDISVFIAMKIQDRFNVALYEGEIGYITLHLIGTLEKLHKSNSRKIVILSPMGEAAHEYLRNRLSMVHDLNIEICDILSMFDEKKLAEYKPDLIVSFLRTTKDTKTPLYVCNGLLSNQDIENIYRILKSKDTVERITPFFKESLYFNNQKFKYKEDVIHFLCDELYKQGYVEKDYEAYVLRREDTAPTVYGNMFAIPHPIEKKAHQNMVSICVLKEPVIWCNQKVKLVFLFALSKERNEDFNYLFEQLVALLDDENKVKKLIKTKNYEQFLEVFFER